MTGPGESGASALRSAPPRLKPHTVCGGRSGLTMALVLAPIRVTKNVCGGNWSSDWWGSLRPSNGKPVSGLIAVLGLLVGAGLRVVTARAGSWGRIGSGSTNGVTGGEPVLVAAAALLGSPTS